MLRATFLLTVTAVADGLPFMSTMAKHFTDLTGVELFINDANQIVSVNDIALTQLPAFQCGHSSNKVSMKTASPIYVL